ncbi:MAG: hypothetical protein R3C45_16400 [Phycisphaerales bacterium]
MPSNHGRRRAATKTSKGGCCSPKNMEDAGYDVKTTKEGTVASKRLA